MTTDIATLGIRINSLEAEVAAERLKKMNKAGAQSDFQFNNLSKTGMKLAATYATAGAAIFGAVKIFADSVKVTAEFNSKISELSAITGATGKDLEYLRDKAKEFGAATTLTASQAAEAFKLIASAKPDLLENGAALAQVTKEAIALAEATGQDLPTAAATLGSALNQFKSGADEASRFINVLAAGAKFGASEVRDTADAMRFAGTVAGSLGVSFEAANAAIQQLSTISLKGGEAGTGLRNVLLRMETDANEKFRPSIHGLVGALRNMRDAGLSTTEMMDMFGMRSITAAQELMVSVDAVAELEEKLTGTTTAYEQQAIQVDNLEGDLKRLNSQWEALLIQMGEKSEPAMRTATNALTDILFAMEEIPELADEGVESVDWLGFAMKELAWGLHETGFMFGTWANNAASAWAMVKGLVTDGTTGLLDGWDYGTQLDEMYEKERNIVYARLFDTENRRKAEEEYKKAIEERGKAQAAADAGEATGGDGGPARTFDGAVFDDLEQAYGNQRRLMEEQAEEDIRRLQAMTGLTEAEEMRRAEIIAGIRKDLADKLRQLREEEAEETAAFKLAQLEQEVATDEQAAALKAAQVIKELSELKGLTAEQEAQRTALIIQAREGLLEKLNELHEREKEEQERKHEEEMELIKKRKEEAWNLANEFAETDLERENIRFAQRLELLYEQAEDLEMTEEEFRYRRELLEEQHQERLREISDKGYTARKKFAEMSSLQQTKTVLGGMAEMTAGLAQHSKTMFKINKAAALANAVVSMPAHIAQTMAKYPFPISVVMGALAAAQSMAQIQAIRSASFTGGGGGTTPSAVGSTPVINGQPVGGSNSDYLNPQQSAPQQEATRTTVVVSGNVGFTPSIIDQIAEGLRTATGERDVTIFDTNSRQARDLIEVSQATSG